MTFTFNMLNKQNVTKFFMKRKSCAQCTTTLDASLRSTDTHTSAGTIFITEGQNSALSIKNIPVREIRHLCDNRHIYSNIQQMVTLKISASSRNRTAVALPIVQLL